MKKLALLLTMILALSCLLMACDTTEPNTDTTADSEAATTAAPAENATETPTEQPTEAPSSKVTYTVTVKDQNGNPVVGAAVQMCDENNKCILPVETNEAGVAAIQANPAVYHVTIVECPDGYTVDSEQSFYFEGDATELTVEITKN